MRVPGEFGVIMLLSVLAVGFAKRYVAYQNAKNAPLYKLTPGKIGAIGPVIFACLILGRSIFSFPFDFGWTLLVLFALALLFVFLPMLIWADVIISHGEVRGPGRLFGPIFGFKRNKIGVRDIVAIEDWKYGYSYIEAQDGRRIYVGKDYAGYPRFIATLTDQMTAAGNNVAPFQ